MPPEDRLHFSDVEAVEQALESGHEIALLDVREHGEFAAGHPFFATSLPLSIFEARLPDLVPSMSCPVVLFDDGHSDRAMRAKKLAVQLGYRNVHVFDGGCEAWRESGRELFEGVFVASKAFGELVEHEFKVPAIKASELARWIGDNKALVIFDGRPYDEHRKMSIPGAICLPNGELVYRAGNVLPDDETTPIVLHCAGRTRSILGAQILRESGLPNPIYALENGTQGWALAGLALETGSTKSAERVEPIDNDAGLIARARCRAEEWGVPYVDPEALNDWLADQSPTTYYIDVRSLAEYDADHPCGAMHAPGGQLLQSTDTWLAVRGARVVLVDDTELRAVTVARWLSCMGWNVHVLRGGRDAWTRVRPPLVRHMEYRKLLELAPDSQKLPVILDLRPSMTYRAAHISTSRWVLRSNLPDVLPRLDPEAPIGICGHDEHSTWLAVEDLRRAGLHRIEWYGDDPDTWAAAGCNVVSTTDSPTDAEAIDFVFFTHNRHSGNLDAARKYLAWETGLISRLSMIERSAFRI